MNWWLRPLRRVREFPPLRPRARARAFRDADRGMGIGTPHAGARRRARGRARRPESHDRSARRSHQGTPEGDGRRAVCDAQAVRRGCAAATAAGTGARAGSRRASAKAGARRRDACPARCSEAAAGGGTGHGEGRRFRRCGSAATTTRGASRAAGRAAGLAAGDRLGVARRRQAVLGHRRNRARDRGGLLSPVFDRPRMAAAAGPRHHRHRRRRGTARPVRAESGPPLSGDGQRARRGRDCDPVLDVLRRARALGPDSRPRGVRAPRAGHGARGGLVDPQGVAVHRRSRPARRLRHAGAPLDGREPADPALRVPDASQHRPRVGRVPSDVAGADVADARVDRRLPVGMGPQIPAGVRPHARDGNLPGVPGRVVRRPPAGPTRLGARGLVRSRRVVRDAPRWPRRPCRCCSQRTSRRCRPTAPVPDCSSGSC